MQSFNLKDISKSFDISSQTTPFEIYADSYDDIKAYHTSLFGNSVTGDLNDTPYRYYFDIPANRLLAGYIEHNKKTGKYSVIIDEPIVSSDSVKRLYTYTIHSNGYTSFTKSSDVSIPDYSQYSSDVIVNYVDSKDDRDKVIKQMYHRYADTTVLGDYAVDTYILVNYLDENTSYVCYSFTVNSNQGPKFFFVHFATNPIIELVLSKSSKTGSSNSSKTDKFNQEQLDSRINLLNQAIAKAKQDSISESKQYTDDTLSSLNQTASGDINQLRGEFEHKLEQVAQYTQNVIYNSISQTNDSVYSSLEQLQNSINQENSNITSRLDDHAYRISNIDSVVDTKINQNLDTLNQSINETISGEIQQVNSSISNLQSEQQSILTGLQSMGTWEVLNTAQNLDDFTTSGKFYIKASDNISAPTTSWVYLDVDKIYDNRIIQTVCSVTDPIKIYYRAYDNGKWQNWDGIVTNDIYGLHANERKFITYPLNRILEEDWYTIAYQDFNNKGHFRAFSEFSFAEIAGGFHNTIKFTASIHYGNNPVINVHAKSCYGIGITGIRILYKHTYDGGVLQLRLKQGTMPWRILKTNDLHDASLGGWKLTPRLIKDDISHDIYPTNKSELTRDYTVMLDNDTSAHFSSGIKTGDVIAQNHVVTPKITSGTGSFPRGWRKITGKRFAEGKTNFSFAHGVPSIIGVTVMAKVNSNIYFANHYDRFYKFTVLVSTSKITISRDSDSNGLDDAEFTIIIDEDLS